MAGTARVEPRPAGQPVETAEERARRLRQERIDLDRAREDARGGRTVPDHDVDGWLDQLVDGKKPPRIPG